MDAYLALRSMPFGCGNQTDNEGEHEGNAFYDDEGEVVDEDHSHFQDGADCGRASGRFISVAELRGRRIAPSR